MNARLNRRTELINVVTGEKRIRRLTGLSDDIQLIQRNAHHLEHSDHTIQIHGGGGIVTAEVGKKRGYACIETNGSSLACHAEVVYLD